MRSGENKSKNKSRTRLMDELPYELRDELLRLRLKGGLTWLEIEKRSPKLEGWSVASSSQLALFRGRRISHHVLQRWYELRMNRLQEQVLADKAKARELAAAFAGRDENESAVLSVLYANQQDNLSTPPLLLMVLGRLYFQFSVHQLAIVLYRLRRKGYVEFESRKNRYTHAPIIRNIRILPRGRAYVESSKFRKRMLMQPRAFASRIGANQAA